MYVPSTKPPSFLHSKKGNGGRKIALATARSSLRFGVEALYPGCSLKNICKDLVTTYLEAAHARSHVPNASADAATDSAPHDPTRDVTPVGRPNYRIACTIVHRRSGKAHNNPVDRRAAWQNHRTQTLVLALARQSFVSRLGSPSLTLSLAIPPALFPPPLLASLGGPIALARLPAPPPLGGTATGRAGKAPRTCRREASLTTLEQTTPRSTKTWCLWPLATEMLK